MVVAVTSQLGQCFEKKLEYLLPTIVQLSLRQFNLASRSNEIVYHQGVNIFIYCSKLMRLFNLHQNVCITLGNYSPLALAYSCDI